jgi:hypothetical protein
MNSPVLMTGAGEGAVGKFETSNGIAPYDERPAGMVTSQTADAENKNISD